VYSTADQSKSYRSREHVSRELAQLRSMVAETRKHQVLATNTKNIEAADGYRRQAIRGVDRVIGTLETCIERWLA
jgi:hypothetical protein